MNEENEIAEIAVESINNSDIDIALEVLENAVIKFPKSRMINGLLGTCYRIKEDNIKAKHYFKKAIQLGSNYELIYLGLYLSYCNLNEDEKAINTMFKYLERNKADLFIDTLEELLEGLIKGYMTNYKDEIIHYAKLNKVKILPNLK